MLAEDAEGGQSGCLAVAAVLACAAAVAGVDDDAVAGADGGDGGADGVDDARAVGAHHPGRRDADAREPADDEQVEAVEGRGLDAEAHVVRPAQLGDWQVLAVLELVEAAVGREGERAQGEKPSGYIRPPTGGRACVCKVRGRAAPHTHRSPRAPPPPR